MKFGTKAIHAGIEPDPSTGAIMTPIYQTSTYAQESPGKHKGYEYSRTHNPTRRALESNLAALENGKHGLCFSSGLAAMDTMLKLFKAGDEIISTDDLYGGSYRLFRRVYDIHERVGRCFHPDHAGIAVDLFPDSIHVVHRDKMELQTKIFIHTPK